MNYSHLVPITPPEHPGQLPGVQRPAKTHPANCRVHQCWHHQGVLRPGCSTVKFCRLRWLGAAAAAAVADGPDGSKCSQPGSLIKHSSCGPNASLAACAAVALQHAHRRAGRHAGLHKLIAHCGLYDIGPLLAPAQIFCTHEQVHPRTHTDLFIQTDMYI